MKSKLALGTVQFGLNYGISNVNGITPKNEVEKILSTAAENNIRILDTAHAYGLSEQVLGAFPLGHFSIVSKFINVTNREELLHQFNLSLERLHVSTLYGYLAHRPLEVVKNPDIWQALKQLQDENKIKKIGFSFNTIDELELTLESGFIPDLVQVPYNYLDNRFEASIIEMKTKYETEIHTRSTFLQGLFFKSSLELPAFFDPIKPLLKEISGVNLGANLLSYVLNKPFIDSVVIGVNDTEQLLTNISDSRNKEFSLQEFNDVIPDDILIPSNWPK